MSAGLALCVSLFLSDNVQAQTVCSPLINFQVAVTGAHPGQDP